MITEICRHIKNFFTYDVDKHFGDYSINDGQITPSIDFKTDYICIMGSRKNDGVHKLSDNDLQDETTFEGAIWEMSIPADFLALVTEIEEWQKKNGAADSAAMSPFASESFGGYSYTKGSTGSDGSSSNGWMNVYASRLNNYRRIRL